MDMQINTLKIHHNDNVAIAIIPLKKGSCIVIENQTITLLDDIGIGHKIAIQNISKDQKITKYGFPIGFASNDIYIGNWVHEHNIKTTLDGLINYEYSHQIPYKNKPKKTYTFDGYIRKNRDVGIRNELWIIPTVGCVNGIAKLISNQLKPNLPVNIDDIHVLEHPFGCSQLSKDHTDTQKILAGLTTHPNTAGVLVLGLGCENNTMDSFKKLLTNYDSARIRFLIAQDVDDEIHEGTKLLKELMDIASTDTRVNVPISKLKIGLKCGGSDAFSGLTANPLVGYVSDRLITEDATTVLTEIPEMFGAESILFNRCKNKDIFDKAVKMVNNFKEYYLSHDLPVGENPSPGNRKGGITTLEDKSLGCVQKGGTAPVVDILKYGQTIAKPGLNILEGPGNDIVAVTALASSGCQIILFTTGRGTPLGSPVPILKISTNNELAIKKKNWIDFNAGQLILSSTMENLSNQLIQLIIDTASGKYLTKNERNNCRQISIWKNGVTL